MRTARIAATRTLKHAPCCACVGQRETQDRSRSRDRFLRSGWLLGCVMDQRTSQFAAAGRLVRVRRHDLSRRLRHRRDRDELRDARLALSQSVFRQRHLHLGLADLDRAGGALRRLFHRRDRGRPLSLGDRARRDRADRLGLYPGAAAVLRAADGVRARARSTT